MRGNKLLKGLSITLSAMLLVAAIPVMATETDSELLEEETPIIPETEEGLDSSEHLEDAAEYSNDRGNVEAEGVTDNSEEVVAVDSEIELTETDEETPLRLESDEESGAVVDDIVVSPKEVTFNWIGQTAQLTVTTTPDDETIESLAWISSDDNVATVDESGLVTAEANGTATIGVEASYNGQIFDGTCTVTVSIFSDGFHQDPESGDWYYFTNGKIADVTDVIKGTVDGTNGWWNVVSGKVTRSETVAKNSNGWWYINPNGMVDFSYNGFAKNDRGSWYCEDGKVTFSKSSVLKDTTGALGSKGTWYYVVDSKVQTDFTGLADYKNDNGWWYIENGIVTFTANTVAQNKNGTYYVKDSKVDFSYNGFASDGKNSWYIENGQVPSNKNSVIKDTTGSIGEKGVWYYVIGGKVQSDFTGLANYKNENGWYYIRNGQVDFTVNTVAKNQNGWYYVLDGKVQFDFTGLANYSNENGWYYIRNGKVDFNANTIAKNKNGWYYVLDGKAQLGFTGLADYSNSNGWWYVKNGKVTFDYTGFAQNKNGWYYIKDSKVDFSQNTVMKGTVNGINAWWYVVGGKVQIGFTGLANYKNENGWWYIKNGQVDFTFNGIATNNNGSYLVQDGKVNFNYNGQYTYGGVTYDVKNGKATHPADQIGMDMAMYNKAQSYSSSTKWLVLVDVTNCKLGIFQGSSGNWAPTKYWTCTTGASSTPTIIGSYTIYDKGKSFGDGYTCWWYNRFHNGYMIHSILYNPGSMTSIQDGRLGQHLSHGCVRLALENAKWVYDNVPYNTKVVTYK